MARTEGPARSAKVTSLYRWADDARFDHDYYGTVHARLATELLAPLGLVRFESDRTVSSQAPRSGAVVATSNAWFATLHEARAALAEAGPALAADLPRYTTIRPELHISEVSLHTPGPAPARSFSNLNLRTPRLELRPLRPGDALALFRIYADPLFMRYWSSPPWTSLSQAADMIAGDLRELAAGEHLRLGIFLAGGELIGTCSLFHLSEPCRRAELGYGIASPHWRRGYMHEAVSAVVGHAFDVLQLNRLEADIDPRNTGSARSLEKLGFTREGVLRERWIVGQEVSDSAIYGLLAREWHAARRDAR